MSLMERQENGESYEGEETIILDKGFYLNENSLNFLKENIFVSYVEDSLIGLFLLFLSIWYLEKKQI